MRSPVILESSYDQHRDDNSSKSDLGAPPKALYEDDSHDHRFGKRASVGAGSTASDEPTNISRRSSIISRIISIGSKRKQPYSMGAGKPFPPSLPDREKYLVEFDGPDDPLHPLNMSLKRKIITCSILVWIALSSAFGSSVFASAAPALMKNYHIGLAVALLGVSLYVLGFASGPIIWAPMSEVYGRKIPLVISQVGAMCFTFAVVTAKDIQTIMICRFFAGFFAAAPLAVVAAAFADLFSMCVFCGPVFGPIIGAFIAKSYLGWRWTMYINGIMFALSLVLCVFCYEESFPLVILSRKAAKIRETTKIWGIYAAHDELELDIYDLATKFLARPLKMLFTEPILLLVTIYTSFVYGILYLCLEAYPIIFGEKYHMIVGVAELPYISVVIGIAMGVLLLIFYFEPRYVRKVAANKNLPQPDGRLEVMLLGAVTFPIGLFWLCWAGNYPQHVHWACPLFAGLFIGLGLFCIFQASVNYIIDTYLMYAASAMAANTFLRSGSAAAFPLFATPLFHNLGVNWAGLLLGGFAALLLPVPLLFWAIGKRLRSRSAFAFNLDL